MKQVIVLAAILPLLLIFIVQFTLQEKNAQMKMDVASDVYTAAEQARQDGCFTEANLSRLRQQLASRAGTQESEIVIDADEVPKYRVNSYNENERIHYRIEVPVASVMAGNRFFGISDEENRGIFVIENEIASERLRP
ncbi:hypothetical protein [Sinanaerobacter chloroacetimidivorans]|uniref:Uncharacterized protein n=1 Tax=Sinanaerobacter chloroacetimidivorans TaxID=2818044 RepID=A0A8J8B0J3_9FIRM|nr:hypothetical protein [Sinanaerobacter chloroacetimidivorans]MBR0597668.1 hypothetical protein [Sinanaerobacter chloroacetimidivorans]